MIHIVEGNILDAPQFVIVHQVNCRGVMGAGLANAIKERWPIVYEEYRNACEKNRPSQLLGSAQLVKVANGRYVANMYAQDNFGRNGRYTNYEAFARSCSALAEQLMVMDIFALAMPTRIGCGLGGGDWNVIKAIIESEFKGFDVWFYSLRTTGGGS